MATRITLIRMDASSTHFIHAPNSINALATILRTSAWLAGKRLTSILVIRQLNVQNALQHILLTPTAWMAFPAHIVMLEPSSGIRISAAYREKVWMIQQGIFSHDHM